MADAPNTVTTLNGLFKEVYGDDIAMLVPDGTKLQKEVPFVTKQKELGNQYHQPVLLAYDHGFTFAGASAGAFTLNDTVAGVMKDASVTGSQIVLRAQLDYEAAARASRGRNAFVDATQLLFESMQKSMRKRLEVELLYGKKGLATVASYSAPTITVTTSEWAPGIWAGMEGASIDVYNGTTKRGTGVISSIDLDARTITLVATVSGTAGGDILYYAGAAVDGSGPDNEMAGVHQILSNTGTLFGVSASTYTLWKASSYAAGSAALSQAKINAAVAKAVAKGLDDDVILMVNPSTWGNLLTDQAALVRNKGQEIKNVVVNGAKSIEFFSQNGKIEVIPSIYVKEGMAFGLQKDTWKRIGAQDVSFKTPSMGDNIFLHIPTKAGFEIRCYTNQAIFSEAPGRNFLITGIVNS